MAKEDLLDHVTGRKFYLDYPDDLDGSEPVTFLLSLHGAGSFGAWQRLYFPACDYVNSHRLVVATPTAATADPVRRWMPAADDDHLRNIVELVAGRIGPDRIRAFWLAGHSQGGITANRLVFQGYFCARVDGYLSLSGGRLGPAEHVQAFGPPPVPGEPARRRPRIAPPELPPADLSFIFAVGEHEIVSLPPTSPWAARYGAGPRVRQTDVMRLDKGHTEGLEPNVTRTLVEMIVAAPGGKLRSASAQDAGP
jgi:hypothetical protein